MSKVNSSKGKPRATYEERLSRYGNWYVVPGKLIAPPGNPGKVHRLFLSIAEKLPKDSLNDVLKHACETLKTSTLYGVYVAHDSMGYPRYVGRGNIRDRLRTRFRAQREELLYYSFYVVADKMHEREIETLLIHVASNLLDFNNKKRWDASAQGSVRDFEQRTHFYERRWSEKNLKTVVTQR